MNTDILKGIEIFGFSGKLSTGKNYICERVFMPLLDPHQTVVMSFADQIKINGIVQHGLDRYKCFVEKDEETRRAMQRIGTEEGRNKIGPDVWVNYVREWMMVYASRGTKRIVITDVRFKNEFDFIRNLGGTLIRIEAPNRNREGLEREAKKSQVSIDTIANHQSEIDLDSGRVFDYVVNNDKDNTEVYRQVRDIVRDIQNNRKKGMVIFCDLDNTICKCNEYYEMQAKLVKDIVEDSLAYHIPEPVFSDIFDKSVSKHNGEYSNSHFHIEKFALSLQSVYQDFIKYMRIDIDHEKNLDTIKRIGMEVFDHTYEDLGGRVESLNKIAKLGRVVIFTMGDRLEQVKKMAEVGITNFDFEVYDFKDETIFRNLMHRYPAKQYVMIGDSLSRDIIPARNSGIENTIRVLYSTSSYWGEKRDPTNNGMHEVNDLEQAYDILKDLTNQSKDGIREEATAHSH